MSKSSKYLTSVGISCSKSFSSTCACVSFAECRMNCRFRSWILNMT